MSDTIETERPTTGFRVTKNGDLDRRTTLARQVEQRQRERAEGLRPMRDPPVPTPPAESPRRANPFRDPAQKPRPALPEAPKLAALANASNPLWRPTEPDNLLTVTAIAPEIDLAAVAWLECQPPERGPMLMLSARSTAVRLSAGFVRDHGAAGIQIGIAGPGVVALRPGPRDARGHRVCASGEFGGVAIRRAVIAAGFAPGRYPLTETTFGTETVWIARASERRETTTT